MTDDLMRMLDEEARRTERPIPDGA